MNKKETPNIPSWAETISKALLQALKEKDPYTYGHCMRVGRNARLLAKAAGLNEYEQILIEYTGIFHDLGKIGIPDNILLKTSQLTLEEELIMQTHPVKSEEIIKPFEQISFFKKMLPGIRHHHERLDGAGYPDGNFGDQIPLSARIILVVDTFDAITTSRPYRKGQSAELAYRELKQFAGRQFDEDLVKIFLKAHPKWEKIEEEFSEEYIAARFRKAA